MKRLMYKMYKRAYVWNELKIKARRAGKGNTDKINMYHPTIKTNFKITFIDKGLFIFHLSIIVMIK